MRFRQAWLRDVLCVPHIPLLGPVHPSHATADVFEEAVRASVEGRMLPYDKDRRWSATKDERVLADHIVHEPGTTLVPTVTGRHGGCLTLYCYTLRPPRDDASAYAKRLARHAGCRRARLQWFSEQDAGDTVPHIRVGELLLKSFADRASSRVAPPTATLDKAAPDIRDTFDAFAAELAGDGFGFLWNRLQDTALDGDVLVATEDARIVGACGPLSLLPVLLPHYFGVLPGHRRRGHGRRLWRAAMDWGHTHGASYKVLQATHGSAAQALYRSEAFEHLGFVYSFTA